MKKIMCFILLILSFVIKSYSQVNQMSIIHFSSGSFNSPDGVIYGEMGWEDAIDVKAVGNNIYALARNYPNTYLLKYSTDGVILNYVVVSNNSSENYNFILTTGSWVFVAGNRYIPNMSNNTAVIKKFNSNDFSLINSTITNSGSIIESINMDDNYLYACVNTASNDLLAKLNPNDFSLVDNVSILPYRCRSSNQNNLFLDNSNAYVITEDTTSWSIHVIKADKNNLSSYSSYLLDEISISYPVFFAANNSNLYALTTDTNSAPGHGIYSYSLSDFSTFQSFIAINLNDYIWPEKFFATDSFVGFGFNYWNNSVQRQNFRIVVYSTDGLKLINDKNYDFIDYTQLRNIDSVYDVNGSTIYAISNSYISKSGAYDNDIRLVRFSNADTKENKAPELRFPLNLVTGVEPERVVPLGIPVTFYVEYFDLDGDPTNYIKININGTDYDMELSSGDINAGYAVFKYSIMPAAGVYNFKFSAADKNDKKAIGIPVDFTNQLIVVKAFDGSLADSDNTIGAQLPKEEFEIRIMVKGSTVAILGTDNAGGGFIAKLSTATNMLNTFPFNDISYYSSVIDDNGNFQVLVSSWNETDSKYNIFFATMNSNFEIIGSSVVLQDSGEIRARVLMYYKNGNRYVIKGGDDNFLLIKQNDLQFNMIGNISMKDSSNNSLYTKAISGYVDNDETFYVVGYYVDTSSKTNGFIAYTSDFVNVSSITFKLTNTTNDKFTDITKIGNYFYVAGVTNNGSDNFGFVIKYDATLNLDDIKIFNIGKKEEVKQILTTYDNNYIIVAGDYEKNYKKNIFLIKLSTVDLDIASIYEYPDDVYQTSYQSGYINGSDLYIVRDIIDNSVYTSTSKIERKSINILSDSYLNLSAVIKTTDNIALSNLESVLVPFDEGEPDIGKIKFIGKTDSSGSISTKALKNTNYLIAFSTPAYGPTVKQQFSDPLQRFIKSFSSDTNLTYNNFYKLNTSTNTFKVVVSNAIKGTPIFVSLQTLNKEPIAFGFTKATDSVVTINVYNVGNLEAGKYKIDVSIPQVLSKTDILYSNFPSTSGATINYFVDFSIATSSGGSYEETKQLPLLLTGKVVDTSNNPIAGAQIKISTGSFSAEIYSDVSGKFNFYGSTQTIGYDNVSLKITKKGYAPYQTWGSNISLPATWENTYLLQPATYSISGYITYEGIPLAGIRVDAGGYDNSKFAFAGNDSYLPTQFQSNQSWVNNYSITNSSGYFYIDGLIDGNVGLYVGNSINKMINMGGDSWENNNANKDDDIRIVISSSLAKPPQDTLNLSNICQPSKVWILNSTGTCIGIAPYTFELSKPFITNATGTITVKYDETGVDDTDATIMIKEDSNAIMKFISLPRELISGTTSYTVYLTSGTRYYIDIISNKWANRSFDDAIELISTDTFATNILLTRAGSVRISAIKPDGSLFRPICNYNGCKWPNIYVGSVDRSYSEHYEFDINENQEPVYVIPNLPKGTYNFSLNIENYGVSEVNNVVVEPNETVDVKFKLQEALVVQPPLTGLAQTDYHYVILSMPSGFEMKAKNITGLLFSDENGDKYVIDYDTITASFIPKYLVPGKYDFYLVMASRYNPDPGPYDGPISVRSFVNFMGKEKGKTIQKDLTNPNLGTLQQPISDFNIYGSIGKSSLSGKITGKNIIKGDDFDKIFSGDLNKLISLIPIVMLYDSAGELRGFAHSIMDSTESFNTFMQAINNKNTQTSVDIFNSSSSYYIAGLPQGKYTLVFISPNYPAISKQIDINGNVSFNFDFDSVSVSTSSLSGKIYADINGSTSPLNGAKIYITHKTFEKTVYSDENGNYALDMLPLGLYKIEVSKDGYVGDGKKLSVNSSENVKLDFTLKQSSYTITGMVYLSKFPQTLVKDGIKVVAYDETKNTQGVEYLSKYETTTDENGKYEIKGLESGHLYKIIATYPGKLTQTVDVLVSSPITTTSDIVFIDIPPQLDVKLNKSKNSLEVLIKSPKELDSVPICEYVIGKYSIDTFDENPASQLALAKLPNNTYKGMFNISNLQPYYTIKVTAGDVDKIIKIINYEVKNDIASESYISDTIYIGGNVYMDSENEEYSGIEIDPGALTQSTSTTHQSSQMMKVMSVGGDDLIGGFFSALPSIKTVKTPQSEMSLSDAISSIMASDVYDIDLTNAQPNKPFTLTLKYDKEKAVDSTNLKIYQYDENTQQWKEVSGTYTIDPMLGTVSVDVNSLAKAYEVNVDTITPFGRKKLGMSAVVNGKFVPQATTSSQSGKFAIFIANPPTGTSYSGTSFEIYNIPNPFNLKAKTVTISSDGGSWYTGNYTTEGTIIKYHLPSGKSGNIKLVIYNIAGEKVRTLDEGSRDGGYVYYSEWDGINDKNEKCASGVYFLVTYLNGDKIGSVHKMAIVK